MSIIVQNEKGKILIFTKGADSVILSRLQKNNENRFKETKRCLRNYSNQGLRTLVIASREIP